MKKNTLKFLKNIAYGLLIPLITLLLANFATGIFLRYYWSGGYIHGFQSFMIGIGIIILFVSLTIVYYIFCAIFFLTKEKIKYRKFLTAAFLIIPIILYALGNDYGIDITICFALFHLTFYVLFFIFRFLFAQISKKKLNNAIQE